MIINRAGRRCEECHRGEDRESRRWLEVHERWAYDDKAKVQALRRLICLCTDCHTATHFGLASLNGKDGEAFEHLCAVTGQPKGEVERQIDAAFELWAGRSLVKWELDLNILLNAGITVTQPPSANERAEVADRIPKL